MLRTRVPLLLAERANAERRAGKTLSSATMDVLQQVLNYLVAADIAVDMAQPLLATLMGVPNPDVDVDPDDVEQLGDGSSSSGSSATVDGKSGSTPINPALWSRERLRLREDARRRTA